MTRILEAMGVFPLFGIREERDVQSLCLGSQTLVECAPCRGGHPCRLLKFALIGWQITSTGIPISCAVRSSRR